MSSKTMKHLAVTVMFTFLGMMTYAQGDAFEAVYQMPRGNPLNDVVALDVDHAVAVGEHGEIVSTSNGGNVWEHRTSPTLESLNACDGIANHVWAVGENGTVLYSNDSGETWSEQEIESYGIHLDLPDSWTMKPDDGMVLIASSENSMSEKDYSDAAGLSITPASTDDFSGIDDPAEILVLFQDHFERGSNDVELILEPAVLTIMDQAAAHMKYKGIADGHEGIFEVAVIVKDSDVLLVFSVDGTESGNFQETLDRIIHSINLE